MKKAKGTLLCAGLSSFKLFDLFTESLNFVGMSFECQKDVHDLLGR